MVEFFVIGLIYMRERFRKNLREMSHFVKEEDSELTEQELEIMQTVLDYHLTHAAKSEQTPKEIQSKIFEIQKEKQQIMEELRYNLRCIDNPECKPEREDGDRLVIYDLEKEVYIYKSEEGDEQEITLGEILTDGEWGISYYLDPDTIPRDIKKKYFVENAKRKLRKLLDKQIIINEINSLQTHEQIVEAYLDIEQRLDSEVLEKGTGIIAEVLLRNFLKKLEIDGFLDIDIIDRKSTRLNSSHIPLSRMPSSA